MMRILRNQKMWAFALGVALVPAQALAQQATAAGQQVGPAVDRYQVGQATPEPTPGSSMLPLTLEQAMDMALEKNLDLKVARMNPQGVDYQLASARAAFMPQLTSLYSYRDAASPNNNRLEERTVVNQVGQNYNVGMSQTMPWYGGRFTANFNNSRQATNSSQTQRNPNFQSSVQFNYTQPLLAGFKMDNTRNQLRTLSVSRQIADIQLLTTIENTKANVRTAYWNLRQAIEQIEIQRRSLTLAQRLFQDNNPKVEIGTLAPIETLTSETQVANAEQALLNAQIQWRTAELNLKRLLAAGPDDEVYRATINPVETAALTVQSVDIPAAVQRAIAERTDLTQARRNLEISQLNLELTQNSTKPQLDLQTGYNLSGQGGPLLTNGVVTTPGGYGQAVSTIAGFDLPTWNVQFNFTYPLFMRAAKANYARAQLQLQQSIAQIQAQELTVSAQVTNAGLAVENTYKQFQAAQKAREVAERNAEAEQTRFDVGMSTNYNVVQAQTNLTTQRLAELRAIISYLNAVAEFDRVQRVGGN
ncbi:MAG: TolC family protein [Acidobacteria bacterium]|nr:TolC family protein [Acidobacteriota bacterium]